MYKLIFYVPVDDSEQVKTAVFMTGAGRIGNYDHCSWEVLGQGQFRPLKGSRPHLGTVQTLETVPELKVELVCEDKIIKEAVAALRRAHPYEEPAYQVFRVEQIEFNE